MCHDCTVTPVPHDGPSPHAPRHVVGTHIIRCAYVEATCVPLRHGGWRITTSRGTSEHPVCGDPYIALDRHLGTFD